MIHRPVLPAEVLSALDPRPGMTVVDATMGGAGHSKLFCEKIFPEGFLLGLDRDLQVAELGVRALISAGYTRGVHFEAEVRRFSTVDRALAHRHIEGCDRLLADLGVNSLHFDDPSRGFSFRADGPLDMRMNPAEPGSVPAADLVNRLPEKELARLIAGYGEERFARRIAAALARERGKAPIETTSRLREVVAGAIPRAAWPPDTDPSTRTFQALRIAANAELEELDRLLELLPEVLRPGGRAGIISFHSLEDRRVKQVFRRLSLRCTCPTELPVCMCGGKRTYREISTRAIVASEEERQSNPRSRSARLRVIEKLVEPE